MHLRVIMSIILLIVSFLLSNANFAQTNERFASQSFHAGERIVVANRASASISIISSRSDEVIQTVDLPPGDAVPEPMYVVYSRIGNSVAVGDRGNNRIVLFDAEDFSLLGTIPAGRGVFHMWGDPSGRTLWVNNDVDNTISVIDLQRRRLVRNIALPQDLVAQGGKPHDIILDHRYAYVTVVGLAADDVLLRYDRFRYTEAGRAPVGKDSHVSLSLFNSKLFVPSQNSDTIFVFDRFRFRLIDEIAVPGAHGAGMTRNGRVLYTTNLPNGGDHGLIAIDTRNNKILGEPADTPFAVPHNVISTRFGRKVYITHSGADSNKVSVFRALRRGQKLELTTTLDVGFNPFGITVIP